MLEKGAKTSIIIRNLKTTFHMSRGQEWSVHAHDHVHEELQRHCAISPGTKNAASKLTPHRLTEPESMEDNARFGVWGEAL